MSWKQLPTNLRKLRHVQTFVIRNLNVKNQHKISPIDCYFTVVSLPELPTSPTSAAKPKEFKQQETSSLPVGTVLFKSFVAKSTLNPSWEYLELKDIPNKTQRFAIKVYKVGSNGAKDEEIAGFLVDLHDLKRLPTEFLPILSNLPGNAWFFIVKGGIYTSTELEKIIRPGIPTEVIPIDDMKRIQHKMKLSEIIRSISATGKFLIQQKKIEKESETVCAKLSHQVTEYQKTVKTKAEAILEQELNKEKKKLDEELVRLAELRKPLLTQAEKLMKLAEVYNQLIHDLTRIREKTMQEWDELHELQKKIERRSKVMLYKLKRIYPIMQSPQEDALITIAGLDVGNLQEAESFSSGLGYACDLKLMISKYLNLPLGRYHLLYSGSKSCLLDMGDPSVGPYHLYLQGTERETMDYTLLLFSSCVKQMCMKRGHSGAKVGHSPSQVLKNLKILLDAEVPKVDVFS
eukprot:TRINITY_DN4269_c0_g1_i2.p1 TRINITY_DN4269_c0_g1~~TRINITY_DN4269_c0_g1_i2.p1  ORF type:complete len:461 (+),score=101.18 TRINITY_DN4269_c0_g1_i2:10-1392(+)